MESNGKLEFKYTVHAVMFGTDITLTNISLQDGFHFERKSLAPLVDHLDAVFDTTAMDLRRDYETARVDGETLDVICAVKELDVMLLPTEAENFFDDANNENLKSLDDQIRAIRLLQECPLRCKKISFRLQADGSSIDNAFGEISFIEILPIYESMSTKEWSKLHCDDTVTRNINDMIPMLSFPLPEKQINTSHVYYDLSYHHDLHIAITLLITALEIIYLKNEEGKKEKLSKRCAAYLHTNGESCYNKQAMLECYGKLKEIYRKRSDFVHEGNVEGIRSDDIIYLRKCVRESIFKLLSDDRKKQERINDLKSIVETIDGW